MRATCGASVVGLEEDVDDLPAVRRLDEVHVIEVLL
jgi:hypothetical protein